MLPARDLRGDGRRTLGQFICRTCQCDDRIRVNILTPIDLPLETIDIVAIAKHLMIDLTQLGGKINGLRAGRYSRREQGKTGNWGQKQSSFHRILLSMAAVKRVLTA